MTGLKKRLAATLVAFTMAPSAHAAEIYEGKTINLKIGRAHV